MRQELIEDFGLSEQEANELLRILDKVKYTQEDADEISNSFDEPIPFEGGMSPREALINLVEVIKTDSNQF